MADHNHRNAQWCYDKPAAERHWERLLDCCGRTEGGVTGLISKRRGRPSAMGVYALH
jgi:hypothetical protein